MTSRSSAHRLGGTERASMSTSVRWLSACWSLLLLAVGGCGNTAQNGREAVTSGRIKTESLRSIAEAEKITLYSIDGVRPDRHPEGTELFHKFPVLGKTNVSETNDRSLILAAIRRGIENCRLEVGANCFWPRHGIRAERGGELVDYVICFECAQIYVYDGGGTMIDCLLTTGEPQSILDRHLAAAGIELAPPP